jgi:hypothetical protein
LERIMSDRDGYISGVPCWVDTSQPDARRAADFYHELFGWDLTDAMPEGSDGSYFTAALGGRSVAAVASAQEGEAPAWNTYVWVDDADQAATLAREAGGRVLLEPFDVFDAGRMAVIADPEGAVFCVWQANRHRGAQAVNEHGALNFNGLRVRDVERAKAFYGALFGWELLDLPSGPMWTRPGYGDHLEESTPGLRDQMAQMGAPDGFIDVVAAVEPIDGDDPSAPQWTVTFAVDDAVALAAKAKELGAQVVGPFDAPWSRQAVITDPQGATFVASQFVPENRDLTTSPARARA